MYFKEVFHIMILIDMLMINVAVTKAAEDDSA